MNLPGKHPTVEYSNPPDHGRTRTWLSNTQGRKTRIPDAEKPYLFKCAEYAPVDKTRTGFNQRNHLPAGGVHWLGNTGRTHSDKERISTKGHLQGIEPKASYQTLYYVTN